MEDPFVDDACEAEMDPMLDPRWKPVRWNLHIDLLPCLGQTIWNMEGVLSFVSSGCSKSRRTGYSEVEDSGQWFLDLLLCVNN